MDVLLPVAWPLVAVDRCPVVTSRSRAACPASTDRSPHCPDTDNNSIDHPMTTLASPKTNCPQLLPSSVAAAPPGASVAGRGAASSMDCCILWATTRPCKNSEHRAQLRFMPAIPGADCCDTLRTRSKTCLPVKLIRPIPQCHIFTQARSTPSTCFIKGSTFEEFFWGHSRPGASYN